MFAGVFDVAIAQPLIDVDRETLEVYGVQLIRVFGISRENGLQDARLPAIVPSVGDDVAEQAHHDGAEDQERYEKDSE
jgi:hypothetical protein